MPTVALAIQAVIVCHWLSNAFQPINVFRYDHKFKTIYILAGDLDELEIIVDEEGEWEFI